MRTVNVELSLLSPRESGRSWVERKGKMLPPQHTQGLRPDLPSVTCGRRTSAAFGFTPSVSPPAVPPDLFGSVESSPYWYVMELRSGRRHRAPRPLRTVRTAPLDLTHRECGARTEAECGSPQPTGEPGM